MAVRYVGGVDYLVCYLGNGTARGKKISVSEMSMLDRCMMFLLCCVTQLVSISPRVWLACHLCRVCWGFTVLCVGIIEKLF